MRVLLFVCFCLISCSVFSQKAATKAEINVKPQAPAQFNQVNKDLTLYLISKANFEKALETGNMDYIEQHFEKLMEVMQDQIAAYKYIDITVQKKDEQKRSMTQVYRHFKSISVHSPTAISSFQQKIPLLLDYEFYLRKKINAK